MDWLVPVALSLGLIIVLFGLVALGWRNRLRRQSHIAPPPAAPADLGAVLYEAQGQYIATTTAGDWLDRVAVHGLGVKSDATAAVFRDGVLFARSGAPDVFIAREALRSVRLERGMAGKYVERNGLVVLTWQLNDGAVDTGFRTRHAEGKNQLLAAAAALIEDPQDSTEQTGKEVQ